MIRLRHKLLIHLLRLFDQAVTLVCLGGIGDALVERYESVDALAILLLAVGSLFFFSHFVRYDSNAFTGLFAQLVSMFKAVTATTLLLLAVSVVLAFPVVSPEDILAFWVVVTAVLGLCRIAIQQILRYSRRSGMTSRQLLIVGFNERARRLAAKFDACPELGYRILGFVCEGPVEEERANTHWTICGAIDDLQTLLQRDVVDEVLICLPLQTHFAAVAHTVRLGEELGIVVRVAPDPEQEAPFLGRMHLELFDGQYVLTFFREHLLFQLLMKRLIDISASFMLLVVLFPLLTVVTLVIKLSSPGPVFFVQERVGMNRRRFKLYKFRSMAADAELRKLEFAHLNEMDGPVFKIANDPRVTPFGRLIRRTSIDELPQLFNVLIGDMSLVGPSPPVPSEVEQYDWLFQRRLSTKPGITCLWQVSGRNQVSFQEWMELDKQYVQNWSLWLDLKILLRTIPVVLSCRGAS